MSMVNFRYHLTMRRRDFISACSASALLAAPSTPKISAATLQAQLTALSVFGRPTGGSFASGVSRIGYSDEDIAGRNYVMALMQKTGAKVRIDAAGNIFAARPGTDNSLPPLLFGSHIDSVPNGGNFDGDLGSLASILVLQTLNDAKIQTLRPLTTVIWACEEASFSGAMLNGSRMAAAELVPKEFDQVSRGLIKTEAVRRIGGNPAQIETAFIKPKQYHAYLELHIEQGGTLARDKTPIGIVDGIVAVDSFEVTITGLANHAGTTPMRERQDALVAASMLILAVRDSALSEPGAQVGTVGHIDVTPNATNVVPGEVRMSLDLRDIDTGKLKRLGDKIRAQAQNIATNTRTQIQIKAIVHHDPALAAPDLQRAIQSAADTLRLDTKHLPSGAGHDAQVMASLMPMGMIFVPSIGGISHSPKELTSWQDCANGANILMESVLALSR